MTIKSKHRIRYGYDATYTLKTPCPFGITCAVASHSCQMCDFYEWHDTVQRTISCSHPIEYIGPLEEKRQEQKYQDASILEKGKLYVVSDDFDDIKNCYMRWFVGEAYPGIRYFSIEHHEDGSLGQPWEYWRRLTSEEKQEIIDGMTYSD